jgi:SanA protein
MIFEKRMGEKLLTILKKALVLLVVGATVTNLYVNAKVTGYLYPADENIPKSTYGLVLGTSKFVKGGGKNIYYEERIKTAAELYTMGKVDTIIASGDNREENYNEPGRMKRSLIELGIPSSIIIEDKDGLDTQRSILNFKSKYENQKVTIISQKFHNQRAVYYAQKNNLWAIGANASESNFFDDTKMYIREYLAKVKAVFM